mmetsp:Transcript_33307/g.54029  ORF Transcript_33307/g.54029 Transcript_33307/m.54029 type:complete len:221 (-) Transcript_33307:6683-7345(-)
MGSPRMPSRPITLCAALAPCHANCCANRNTSLSEVSKRFFMETLLISSLMRPVFMVLLMMVSSALLLKRKRLISFECIWDAAVMYTSSLSITSSCTCTLLVASGRVSTSSKSMPRFVHWKPFLFAKIARSSCAAFARSINSPTDLSADDSWSRTSSGCTDTLSFSNDITSWKAVLRAAVKTMMAGDGEEEEEAWRVGEGAEAAAMLSIISGPALADLRMY